MVSNHDELVYVSKCVGSKQILSPKSMPRDMKWANNSLTNLQRVKVIQPLRDLLQDPQRVLGPELGQGAEV